MGLFVAGALIFVGGIIVLTVVAVFCDTVLRGRVPCPECGGDGRGEHTVVGHKKDWDGASPHVMRDSPVYRKLKCVRCGGWGTIPKSQSARPAGPTWSTPVMVLQAVVLSFGLILLGTGAVLLMN